MSVIQAEGLCKSYGQLRALENLSFSVNKGEVVGLLGPNGAGKTTLMKLLTGYLQPDEGSASIAGIDVIANRLAVQRRLGYLPENAPVYTDMVVQEYLLMMAALRQVPLAKQREFLADAIFATGLQPYLTRPIGTLSKGYRQRVGLAQAILHKPEVLILDEPTTGLDPSQIVEIRSLIKRLSEHSTIILSTHILGEVEITCKRVIVVIGGELRVDAPIDQLNPSSNEVIIAIEASAQGVAKTLEQIESVKHAEVEMEKDGYNYWRIKGTSPDLAARVFDALRKESWRVTELRSEKQNLERVFRELTFASEESTAQPVGAES